MNCSAGACSDHRPPDCNLTVIGESALEKLGSFGLHCGERLTSTEHRGGTLMPTTALGAARALLGERIVARGGTPHARKQRRGEQTEAAQPRSLRTVHRSRVGAASARSSGMLACFRDASVELF